MFSSPSLQNPSDVIASPTLGGPRFGTIPHAHALRENIRLLFIAFAVLAVSILWIRSNQPSEILAHLARQSNIPPSSVSQNTEVQTSTNAPGVTLELKNDGMTAEIPGNQIDVITEQAKRNDGITHLARRALAEHLQDGSISLSPEQRIYAEDFVQKAMGRNALRANQKLSFPTQLLDKAIQKAQGLTPHQIQNLSHYTAYVHFQ